MPIVNEIKATLKSRETFIIIYVALALIGIHYLGDVNKIRQVDFRMWMGEGEAAEFKRLAYWTLVNLLFYLCIPLVLIKFIFKENPAQFGFSPVEKGGNRIYLYLFLCMLPLVIGASFTSAFQHKYPYYQVAPNSQLWPWFWAWELLYFFQFFGLEFFFRGFMVLGLKNKFELNSVLIMTLPYCMIHFSKPMPEAIGSIVAGLLLGYLSYKKRSVIPGAILHFSVALTMDMLALWQKGIF